MQSLFHYYSQSNISTPNLAEWQWTIWQSKGLPHQWNVRGVQWVIQAPRRETTLALSVLQSSNSSRISTASEGFVKWHLQRKGVARGKAEAMADWRDYWQVQLNPKVQNLEFSLSMKWGDGEHPLNSRSIIYMMMHSISESSINTAT